MRALPRIIGLTGYARHGKDTIAEVLTRELGYNRIALADKMKELLLVLNPLIVVRRQDWAAAPIPVWDETIRLADYVAEVGWDEAKKIEEVRRLLQVFGTEVGREGISEDVWIEALARSTPGFYGYERKIVIPDVRFINEAQFIRRLRGEVWKVTRPGFDNGIGVTHDSERNIGSIVADEQAHFINDRDVDYLKAQVIRYIKARRPAITLVAT